ncbi:DUF3325 domain-containing protein [Luteimonas sp. MC1750]|uniref:DUF3325 domain-containing protein n=1 Tax=Luteimonas sp. MC1750 TaxID=2799326 RepID=UPI0018F0C49A|nr:DUF3325 domain-containing protein [Luteimonas sp. MC1750]MBJ6983855.1 DUF3325 domain-containing protein [Luteimonas sp. MC1750]QQO06676.1 DUF3325 domain-containing protein [Luteimonas sp. MC1750]
MHEPGATTWLLAAAACAFAGMGWLALAMPVHALQAWGAPPSAAQLARLRWLGGSAVLLALACCLGSDHATMAVLVWVMLLAAAAVAMALVIAGRPRRLRLLAPWVRPQPAMS